MRRTLITTLAAIMLAASLPATAGRRDAPPAPPAARQPNEDHMSLHTPERQPNETRAKYRERQAKSRAAVQRMTLTGQHRPPGHKEPNGREIYRRAVKLAA